MHPIMVSQAGAPTKRTINWSRDWNEALAID
jgi:hypothetical protein